MKRFISMLSLFFLVAMSQAGLRAMSQITETDLFAGTYDFRPDLSNVFIHAYGTKDGEDVEVFCEWKNMNPLIILIKKEPRKKFTI